MSTESSGESSGSEGGKQKGEGARASDDLKQGFREGSADDVGRAAERLGAHSAEHAGKFLDSSRERVERAPATLREKSSALMSAASPSEGEKGRLKSESEGIKSSLESIRDDAKAVAGEARRQAGEARTESREIPSD